ncbi:hypothetical protein [Mycobacteroides abscessus]|uniref:hypothetical protein n=1 Tax=Mycobacteroides abscessus TaxID=36809 RepID=UPI0012FFFF2D|nr:hypothetical protein [Mycobacteroides abscessus]
MTPDGSGRAVTSDNQNATAAPNNRDEKPIRKRLMIVKIDYPIDWIHEDRATKTVTTGSCR